MNSINVDELVSFVKRIEALEAEKADVAEEIKAIKDEAKAAGFDIKAINFCITLRKKEREECIALHDYADALGIFG